MVIIDSSAWIEAIRRTGSIEVKVAVEALLEAYQAAICPPVLLEVLGGARRPERPFLEGYFGILPYVSLGPEIWRKAIGASWRLRDDGVTLPWNGLLIGTLAIETGCRVYAVDQHFEILADKLGLRLYRPGYGGSFQPEEKDPC